MADGDPMVALGLGVVAFVVAVCVGPLTEVFASGIVAYVVYLVAVYGLSLAKVVTRAGTASTQRDQALSADALTSQRELPLLPGVVATMRRIHPDIPALSHVTSAVSDFLDVSRDCSLLRACKPPASIELLRRIHARERLAPPMNRYFRDLQVTTCLAKAAAEGDLKVVK